MNEDTEIAAHHHEQELEQMQTTKLNAALAKARADIHNPPMDSTNPHFRSKFASLKAVINATIPVLAKHGISVVQDLVTEDRGVACYTYLLHESGEERMFGPFVVPPTKNDAQGYASASTYARRYHLMGIVGVVGDVDDDGNAAVEKQAKMPEKQARAIADLLDAADVESMEGVHAFAEAWMEMDSEEQKTFAPWIASLWPGKVSKVKAHMHDVMGAWRKSQTEAA